CAVSQASPQFIVSVTTLEDWYLCVRAGLRRTRHVCILLWMRLSVEMRRRAIGVIYLGLVSCFQARSRRSEIPRHPEAQEVAACGFRAVIPVTGTGEDRCFAP